MTIFSRLPTEIWLLIAGYISEDQLSELKSLNRFFLDCWMDTEWNDILINTHDPEKAIRTLQRAADPFVQRRTKNISLYLDMARHASSRTTFQTTTSVLLSTIPLFTSVTSLKIHLFKITDHYLAPILRKILSSTMAGTLETLSVDGYVELLGPFGEYSAHDTPFKKLTKLTLVLMNLDMRDMWLGDLSGLLSTKTVQPGPIVPFLLSIAPTLQSLQIQDKSNSIDLSPLFDAISDSNPGLPIPFLTSLFLNLNFTTSLQSSPKSLHRFIFLQSNNLQHLQLSFKSTARPQDTIVEQRLGKWLAELVNKNFPLTALRTLEISPSVTEIGLSAVLTLIKRSATHLSSLAISYRSLTRKEVKAVLDALTEGEAMTENPGKLKKLSVQTTYLSVSFLDLVAHKLPDLEYLFLELSAYEDSDERKFLDVLHKRRYELNASTTSSTQDILHSWKLRHIEIRTHKGTGDNLMRAAANAVPFLSPVEGPKLPIFRLKK